MGLRIELGWGSSQEIPLSKLFGSLPINNLSCIRECYLFVCLNLTELVSSSCIINTVEFSGLWDCSVLILSSIVQCMDRRRKFDSDLKLGLLAYNFPSLRSDYTLRRRLEDFLSLSIRLFSSPSL